MSIPNPSPNTSVENAIQQVLDALAMLDPESEEYAKATDQLVKLHRLKQEDGKLNLETHSLLHKQKLEERQTEHQELLDAKRKPVSTDTLVLAGANLLGIIAIVAYEQKHIWGSKAAGFIKTLR